MNVNEEKMKPSKKDRKCGEGGSGGGSGGRGAESFDRVNWEGPLR